MSKYIWGNQETQFFFKLTPEIMLDAVSELGFEVTGRCLTLNSMENRVYEIEIDNQDQYPELSNNSIIAKFYRPGRWSQEQIQEEHSFLRELKENEVSVIAPISFSDKTIFTLNEHEIFYSIFPKKGGRAPDEMNNEQLQILGRSLARLHNTGDQSIAEHRIQITPQTFGLQNLRFLLENKYLPAHIEPYYKKHVEEFCELITPLFKDIKTTRIHGDCHLGNIISREDEGLFFIDFDDMLIGPAVQDIWLLTPGRDEEAIRNRNILLDSYQEMRDFDYREIKLVEALRTLRFIHFSAWIAKRWEDPAFKVAFSHFGNDQYWDTQLNDLQYQKTIIQNQIKNDQAFY